MAQDRRRQGIAAGLALGAAFLWSTYYFFVLAASPAVAPSALLCYPLLIGGALYALWCSREGHFRSFLRLWASGEAWIRAAILFGLQVSILAGTYLVGPVDTALLSLVGDVVLTPLLVMTILRDSRERARSLPFVGGLALSLVGASMTIIGGQSVAPIVGWGWLIVIAVPLTAALYLVATARAMREAPTSAIVAQDTLGSGLLALLVLPLVPGGFAGLVVHGGFNILLVVSLGVVTFFLAAELYFVSIERAGLILTTLLMAFIPVFTLVLSILLLNLTFPLVAILGLPLAVAGAALALQGQHPPWPSPGRGGTPLVPPEGDPQDSRAGLTRIP